MPCSRLTRALVLLAAGCLLAVPATVSSRAADPTLVAAWGPGDVVVDGSLADWPRLERVHDGPAVAVRNDARTLWLVVASNDTTVREQLATGLIAWLDRTTRKARTFGLRLEGLTQRPLPGAAPDTGSTALLDRGEDLNELDRFDLLGPGESQRRLIDDPDTVGIVMAVGVADGMIVYELSVPLVKTSDTPYAPDASPGATLGLGLETPPNPRQTRRRSTLDDPMSTRPRVLDPYGYGGFFEPPSPPGGRLREPREAVLEPMKLMWAELRLAAAPDTAGDAH